MQGAQEELRRFIPPSWLWGCLWLVDCNKMRSFLGVDSACCPFRVAGHEGWVSLQWPPHPQYQWPLYTFLSPLCWPSFVSSFSASSFSRLLFAIFTVPFTNSPLNYWKHFLPRLSAFITSCQQLLFISYQSDLSENQAWLALFFKNLCSFLIK